MQNLHYASKDIEPRLKIDVRVECRDSDYTQVVYEFLPSIGKVKHDKCLYTYLCNITYMYHFRVHLT